MTFKHFIAFALAVVMVLSLTACAAKPTSTPTQKEDTTLDKNATYNVLFIGNSYTYYNDLWDLFAQVAESGGYTVTVDYVTQGGYYLDQFLNPDDPFGKELQDKLQTNTYDFVFIQEQSTCPFTNYERFADAATTLHGMITQNGAQCILYETWARETGSPALTANNWTNAGMTADLCEAYETLAATLNTPLSPVGAAFYDIHTTCADIDLYDADTTHPSKTGSYLAALCHYATVTGDDPRHVAFNADETAEVADTLKEAAYRAIFGA